MKIWPFRVSPEIQTVLDAMDRVEEWEFCHSLYDEIKHKPSGLCFIKYLSGWHSGIDSVVRFDPTAYESKCINRCIGKLLNRMTANVLAKKESDHA